MYKKTVKEEVRTSELYVCSECEEDFLSETQAQRHFAQEHQQWDIREEEDTHFVRLETEPEFVLFMVDKYYGYVKSRNYGVPSWGTPLWVKPDKWEGAGWYSIWPEEFSSYEGDHEECMRLTTAKQWFKKFQEDLKDKINEGKEAERHLQRNKKLAAKIFRTV